MRRTSRAEWAERVAQWKRSGESASEFAARQGWKPATLQWWAAALRRETRLTVPVIEVKVAEPAERIEVLLRDGVRIKLSKGFDAELLRQVMQALEAR